MIRFYIEADSIGWGKSLQVAQVDKTRIPANIPNAKYLERTVLAELTRQRIPIVFTNIPINSFSDLPPTARKEAVKFLEYVTEIDNMLKTMGLHYFLKVSFSNLKCVYKSKSQRVYVPQDIIVVIRRNDLEIAIMPSTYEYYLEIRNKNDKDIIASMHIRTYRLTNLVKLFKALLSMDTKNNLVMNHSSRAHRPRSVLQ